MLRKHEEWERTLFYAAECVMDAPGPSRQTPSQQKNCK
jgi:hypothetical protein